MKTPKHFIALTGLLPDAIDAQDACIKHLTDLIKTEQGLIETHLDEHNGIKGICIHYDPNQITLAQLKIKVAHAGAKIAEAYQHTRLYISGMDCSDCTNIVEHALSHMPGVLTAKVNYAGQLLRLEYDAKQINLQQIIKKIKQLGFTATQAKPIKNWFANNFQLFLSGLAGLFLILSWLLNAWNFSALSFIFIIFTYLCAGIFTLRNSWQLLVQKQLDIDLLMLIAAIGAAAIGSWFEGAFLLFLFSLGHALEHKALQRSQQAIEALASFIPQTATLLKNGKKKTIAIKDIQFGDLILVKAGQIIPVDGQVAQGHSSVNEAAITGEAIPADKQADDLVYAGSINGEGTLNIKVSKLPAEFTINRLTRMVHESSTRNASSERFANKFSKIFVPTALILAILYMIIFLALGESLSIALAHAITILVAASPCALALASPVAIICAITNAAQKGILIKSGKDLENLSLLKAIALDKTGTLTEGKPQVVDIIPINSQPDELLAVAASLEQTSNHPLATAVVQIALKNNIKLLATTDTTIIPGYGMKGLVNGFITEIGNAKLFAKIPEIIEEKIKQLQANGRTIMLVRHDNKWLGLLGLSDTIRPETVGVLQKLKEYGIEKFIMLTGDNEAAANDIAKKIGINEIQANLLPEAKTLRIKALANQYKFVGMVGDGINDAAALAQATVGIAIGGAGNDIALEAADVVLMSNSLKPLPFAIHLSRFAYRIIKQNLYFSLSIVIILVVFALFGMGNIDIIVAIHEGATLLVIFNGLRLLS